MKNLLLLLVIVLINRGLYSSDVYAAPIKSCIEKEIAPVSLNIFVAEKQHKAHFLNELKLGKKITIVTMGTSLTGGAYRWPDIMMDDWLNKEYPGQVTLFNEAVGASSSSVGPDGNNNLSGLGKLPVVISHNPDVVFIEFAINDAYLPYHISLADSKKNLEKIISSILKANPGTEIILATMNSCKDTPTVMDANSSRPNLNRYYQGYRKVAEAHNFIILDFYPVWLNLMQNDPARFDRFAPDGIHPSLEGYRSVLLPLLRKVLDSDISD